MAKRRRFSEEAFGTTVERLMDEQGVTYRQLASRTGLSAGYLNHLVHGNRPVPSNDVVKTLAEALEVEPEHFREFRLRSDHRAARGDARADRPALQAPRVAVERVAQEEVRLVRPHRAQPAGDAPLRQELDALDEAEARCEGVAREERRDGEEELVDELGGDELPEERRARLGDDHAVTALA